MFSIRTKLFIAIFLACLLTVGGLAGVTQWLFKERFLAYVNEQESRSLAQLETALVSWYAAEGSWEILRNNPERWESLLLSTLRSSVLPAKGANEPPAPPPARHPPLHHALERFIGRIVLLDSRGQPIMGTSRGGLPTELRELRHDQQLIGYLGIHRRQRLTEKVEMDFSERWQRSLWAIVLLALPITGLLAFGLARHLGKPIQALRDATRQLASGHYALRMKADGHDELADLTNDFNTLAATLQQNETARKQWIADIAHELRTPLAILRGEIEALQDGINQANPQTLASLHQEVSHLQRLVSDLYDLSMSDSGALSYRKERMDVIAVLRDTLTAYSSTLQEQALSVDVSGITPEPVYLRADVQRFQQLFKNLLENSLRYTDKPGQLQIRAAVQEATLTIVFADSAPGVPDAALPHLFERLYRVETSRNRATGGTGLGLSICRNIVAAHDGTITAERSALGGLAIRIQLRV